MKTSRRQGWHKRSQGERLDDLFSEIEATSAERREIEAALLDQGLSADDADRLSENVIGRYALPFSVVPNFIINGQERFLTAVTEEPSVVAAMGNAARWARAGGGFTVEVDPPLMIAQIEMFATDPETLCRTIESDTAHWLNAAIGTDPKLEALGGGLRAIELRRIPEFETKRELLIVELLIDVREAMGANAVNTYAERMAALFAEAYDVRIGLRIVSNLCDRRLAKARVAIPCSVFSTAETEGMQVARAIESASRFAESDSYRAATHNKGIMNGADAVLTAFGQDWRAVEAAAHAYAARDGRYASLSRWRVRGEVLHGELALPLAVGLIGGAPRLQKLAMLARRMCQVTRAVELAECVAVAGLASNLAALRALSQEGIQAGHMRLHRRGGA